jgi:penicillin-binding protein 1C
MSSPLNFINRKWLYRFISVVLLLCLLKTLDGLLPLPPAAFQGATTPGTLVVLASDGTPLRTWPGADGALRQPTTPEAVSPLYLEALRQYEDRWFDWHPGINPLALMRAGWQWMRHGRVVSGGSTLTMQVARILEMNTDMANASLGADTSPHERRSLSTKLRQMARALQLEWHLSKRDILVLYLNHAPMGGQVQGVEMAARAYLGKSAASLSRAEAALLVALPQNPSRWRPDRAPELAQAARDKVLTRMADLGVWPATTVADAKLERVFAPPLRARWLAPLAAERLRQAQLQRLRHRTGESAPGGGAANVLQSTLDAGVQMRLEQVLTDRLPSLPPAVSVAALVVDNATLAIRGYAGSADFADPQRAAHVDMVRGVRSPGSTLKPFLYAMALDEGLIHSESLLIDAPQSFGGYAPGNFQAAFSGPVSVSEALQRSLNVPAVDLLERLDPARFAAKLRNAGLKLRMPQGAAPNLSIILGGAGTTLEELVGAYTALARGGVAGQPRLQPDEPTVNTPLMSAGAAFIVREILENGGRPGAPFREGTGRVAWKTGTSFGFRDAWAIGVTDRYTLGVWVGRPDGTPNPGFFGANTAAPLVKDLLTALDPDASDSAHQTAPARQPPPDVVAQDICWPLGLAATTTDPASFAGPPQERQHPLGGPGTARFGDPFCMLRRSAWTLQSTAPPTLPDRLSSTGLLDTAWVDLRDARHPVRLRPGCSPTLPAKIEATTYARWPTLLQPWITREQRSEVERLPLGPACRGEAPSRSLHIVGLDSGTTLHPVPGQRVIKVQVHALGSAEMVHWLLDGQWVGSTSGGPSTTGLGSTPNSGGHSPAPDRSLSVTLERPGPHTLTALDASGRYGQVGFALR